MTTATTDIINKLDPAKVKCTWCDTWIDISKSLKVSSNPYRAICKSSGECNARANRSW